MVTEKTLGEEQKPPVGPEGADQVGEEFATNTEEQLFGKGTTPPEGEASKGKPEGETEIPLEVIQAHPAFSDLQGKHDRQKNVLTYQTEQIGQLNQQLKVFRDKQAAELLEQLGDTPETRNAVALIQRAQDMEGQAMMVMQQFGPLLKQERAKELLTQEGLPPDYLDDLVVCETFEEAVQKAKTIKSVLAKMPKPAPGQKVDGTTKPRSPALSHKPDKAQGSVAPQDFAQAEELYIAGKIPWPVYKAAADKAGVQLQ
jgi:hypothetical protein